MNTPQDVQILVLKLHHTHHIQEIRSHWRNGWLQVWDKKWTRISQDAFLCQKRQHLKTNIRSYESNLLWGQVTGAPNVKTGKYLSTNMNSCNWYYIKWIKIHEFAVILKKKISPLFYIRRPMEGGIELKNNPFAMYIVTLIHTRIILYINFFLLM